MSYDPRTLYYDAENRIYNITSASNGSGSFAYDGDGQRIKKVWTPGGGSTTTTVFVYDVQGQVAAEYSTDSPSTAETYYPFADLLGSVRTVTDGTGAVVECYDYLPFGRMLSSSDNGRSGAGCYPATPDTAFTSSLPEKFTGKERDAETGLDYFGARYLSASEGRFLSPDLGDADPKSPGTWNRYGYTLNNPLMYVDPDGKQSMSALFNGLIKAEGRVYVPTAQTFDALVLYTTIRSSPQQYDSRVFKNNQPSFGYLSEDSAGGCGFGCYTPLESKSMIMKLDISFSYDSPGLVSKANIVGVSGNTFGKGETVVHGSVIPGDKGAGVDIRSIQIDTNQFKGMDAGQLLALYNGVGLSKLDATTKSILKTAVKVELQRREQEQKQRELKRR